MSEIEKNENPQAEERDLSLEEMDEVTGGAPKNQEEVGKVIYYE